MCKSGIILFALARIYLHARAGEELDAVANTHVKYARARAPIEQRRE